MLGPMQLKHEAVRREVPARRSLACHIFFGSDERRLWVFGHEPCCGQWLELDPGDGRGEIGARARRAVQTQSCAHWEVTGER
jgi:hypothetical protein